ncbi:MAG: phage tail protein [Acidimicrobiales bacterium]
MSLAPTAALGLANRFQVVVDGVDLGGWAKCSGLEVKFTAVKVKEGGNYDYEIILPGRIGYTDITLERAMTKADSDKVQQWLASKANDFTPGTAQISLYDHKLQEVGSWSIRGVYPLSWTCPGLDANTAKVAVEVLKLQHEGFL